MDISYLNEDEIMLECEVRGLKKRLGLRVSEALRQELNKKLAAEKAKTVSVPVIAHQAAVLNPKREAKACAIRLTSTMAQLLEKQGMEEIDEEVLNTLEAKMWHTYGRIIRIRHSQTLKDDIPPLMEASQKLIQVLLGLQNKTTTLAEAIEDLKEIVIPVIVDKVPKTPAKPSTSQDGTELPTDEVTEDQLTEQEELVITGDETITEREDALISGIATMKASLDEHLNVLQIERQNRRSSTGTRRLQVSESADGYIPEEERTIAMLTGLRIRKDLMTWNLKFEGSRSSVHIERFFYRVERMATEARIPLNNLVEHMTLLLGGEALEWYWMYLERHQAVPWEVLKREMIQRFQASRSDDDIRRLLGQRKQQYPRESFLEFHDAIVKLALQAKKPLRDNEIYNILRRNMRPGLQIELFKEKSFVSMASFIRRCVETEDMWKRFGINPESRLSLPQNSYQHHQQPGAMRYPPRVHEMVEEDPLELEEDPIEWRQDPEYEEDYVCAMANQQPKARPAQQHGRFNNTGGRKFFQPTSIMKKPDGERRELREREMRIILCWNCGENDHTFYDCRKLITHVFCFGCGTKGVYKPDCVRCNNRDPGNYRREMRNPLDTHLGNNTQPTILKNKTTEEAASNTDPELSWRRRD